MTSDEVRAFDLYFAAAVQGLTAHHGRGEIAGDLVGDDPDYAELPAEMRKRIDGEGGGVAFRAMQIARAGLACRRHLSGVVEACDAPCSLHGG